MAIYIKGMEMPKGCEDCLFFHRSDYGYKICNFPLKARRIYYGETKRQDFCPLTEVSEPHGRLIDADKALDELFRDKREAYTKHSVWLMFSIHGAPTIIERSKT